MTPRRQEALIAAVAEHVEDLRRLFWLWQAAERAEQLAMAEKAAARSPAAADRAAADVAAVRLDVLAFELRAVDQTRRAVLAILRALDAGADIRTLRRRADLTWRGLFAALAMRPEAEQRLAETAARRAPRSPARSRRRAPRTAR